MIKILASKAITSIAYAVIGSEVVRENLTVDNARKVAAATGKAAKVTGRAIHIKAAKLKEAVAKRKAEIQNRPPY